MSGNNVLSRLLPSATANLRGLFAKDARCRRQQILVLGPAPGQAGGISSVMSYLGGEYSARKYDLIFIDTIKNGHWSISRFIGSALRTIALILYARVMNRHTLVHLNVSTGGSTYRKWFIALLCRLSSTPYVIHLHGSKYRRFFSTAPKLARKMVFSLFGSAFKVIVLGTVWRDYLVQEGVAEPTKISIIANGTPAPGGSSERSIADRDCVRVIYSGRLSVEKGIRDLLQAADLLYATVKNFELVLMGDSRDPSLLRDAQSRPYCNITGWLANDQVLQQLRNGDVFVLPSHDEGLPMSMIEAMSLGMPVLVTDVGAISDVIVDGEEGLIVQSGDIEGLSAALRTLVQNSALRERMGIRARRRWESELRADQMTRRIERHWDEALHAEANERGNTR